MKQSRIVRIHRNHNFHPGQGGLLKYELHWRWPVFEYGRYLIGFDGTALLLLELWQRSRADQGDGGADVGLSSNWKDLGSQGKL
jgi:hypothetical protein